MIPGRKIAVIVNPHSAAGKTASRWPRIQEQIQQRLGTVAVRFTERPGHATELARELLAQEFDLIAGVGGDGTFNEIANGFVVQDQMVRPAASMGILPAGTGGDFQRMFGFSSRNGLDDAIETLSTGQPVAIDLGKVKYTDRQGSRRERYFVNLVSFGMGGAVAAGARNFLTPLGGKVAFLWSTFRVLLSYRGKAVEIRVDQGKAAAQLVTNVAIGNGRFHGGGMYPCPMAKMDDGILDVTVIQYMNMFRVLRDIRVLYSGEVYDHPKTRHLRGTQIEASATSETLVEVDGEPLGMLPLEVTVLPRKLPVMMGRGGAALP
ncbi:MAG: diacylglycerol/lipid kinase family protein [Terriglobia bacterium]